MNDPWIEENSPIPAAKLHALGLINLRWNTCDFLYRALHASFNGPPFDAGWEVANDWRPSQIADDIKRIVTASRWAPEAKEAFLYAIDMVELCRANRNHYSHFVVNGTANGLELRRSKAATFAEIFVGEPIDVGLATLRRTAEEIDATSRYLVGLLNMKAALFYQFVPGEPLPLPERPPLPETVWTGPPDAKSRPRPYQRRSSLP